jgi:hypothetical protein
MTAAHPNGTGRASPPVGAGFLRQLDGCVLDLEGRRLRIQSEKPWSRGEGYTVLATDLADMSRMAMKLYHQPSPERFSRIAFLERLELDKALPAFAGAPRGPFSIDCVIDGGTPVHLAGHLAPFVDGEPLSALREDGWDPTREVRLRLASQLAQMVRVLEAAGLVHGDMSGDNVMITAFEGPDAEARLIDFDGYHFDGVPAIPATTARGGRGWGTPGYRHPRFCEGRADLVLRSDRFALAALLFEVVALRPSDFAELGRTTLIDERFFAAGSVDRAMGFDERRALWPGGAGLLDRALRAAEPGDAPSPAEWLREIYALAQSAVRVRATHRDAPLGTWTIRKTTNTFADIHPGLGWLAYERVGQTLRLEGTPPTAAFVRNPRAHRLVHVDAVVAGGHSIHWDDFDLYFETTE